MKYVHFFYNYIAHKYVFFVSERLVPIAAFDVVNSDKYRRSTIEKIRKLYPDLIIVEWTGKGTTFSQDWESKSYKFFRPKHAKTSACERKSMVEI